MNFTGGGHMDSPGHSTKYCTYTVMNQADKILAMEIIDKRECQLKSGKPKDSKDQLHLFKLMVLMYKKLLQMHTHKYHPS